MLETLGDLEVVRLWSLPSKHLQYIQFEGLLHGKKIISPMDSRNSSDKTKTRDEIYGNVCLVLM